LINQPKNLGKENTLGRDRIGFDSVSIAESYERFLTRQLFEPWAADLVARAQLQPGAVVLDVASGTGAVARRAAGIVGPNGRVVASDLSSGMLAVAMNKPLPSASATIECQEGPATALGADDAVFDVVLCQQGLQFFPERDVALREMRRVLRPGGGLLVSTWAAERPLGLFGPLADTLAEFGLAEPFPRAFDSKSYGLSARRLESLLVDAGFRDVVVETADMEAYWDRTEDAVETLTGTPFAPLVAGLALNDQAQVRALFARRLNPSPEGAVTVATVSNIARARK
jgi:ubiquinone/menaquinone biosynthesis C-methylase UbiE